MKILLINHFPLSGSGSGVYTLNIAKSLVKLGHEVSIIMPENEEVLERNGNISIYPVYFNTDSLPFNFPCFTTHPRSIKTFYELTSDEYSLYKNAFINKISNVVNSNNFDVIHSGHIWTLSSVAAQFDIPLIITAHGTDLIGFNKGDERFRKDAVDAFLSAKAIVTISRDNMNLVNNIFNDSSKTHMILNGYDSNIFKREKIDRESILNYFGISRNYDKVVCFVGKFTHLKGIDVLLKACQSYFNDNVLTLLAGDGELLNDMKHLSLSLGLSNVVFLGNRKPEELNLLFNISDVSVVPSRSEAFGLVAIEALACGTPVVVSDEGGLRDIVNSKVGRMFQKEDSVELASYINMILNGELSFDRGYVSRFAKDNYSQDNFVDSLLGVYDKAIEEHSRKLKL